MKNKMVINNFEFSINIPSTIIDKYRSSLLSKILKVKKVNIPIKTKTIKCCEYLNHFVVFNNQNHEYENKIEVMKGYAIFPKYHLLFLYFCKLKI